MAASDDLRRLLADAASAGGVVRIVYRGGSHPGSVREIAPISVSGTQVVARDLAAGLNKTFSIAKIELPDDALSTPAYDPLRPADTRSVRETVEPNLEVLRRLGWHVELSADAASLHRFFKNGKARRTPDVQFTYDEFTVDCFDDGDGRGMQEVRRPSKLPFHVSSTRLPTRSFAGLAKALLLFLDEAKGLGPGRD